MVHTSPLMLKEPKGEPIPSPPSLHFVRSESPPRKVGLTPRLHRRRRDDAQCNLRSCSSSNSKNNNNFYAAVDEQIPTVASPPHTNKATQKDTDGKNKGEGTEYDFTLTPTVLYGVTEEERAAEDHHTRRAQTVEVKRYHRSPHWSGKVNINPFSPVPEQYLCATSNSPLEKQSSFDNDACDAIGKTTKKAKRARLSPTTKSAKSDIVNGGGVNFYPRGLQQATERKRKVNYSIQDTSNHEGSNNKRICLPNERSRYLDDFEEIQFLGAGSFGTVCACLSRLDGCMYAIKSISPDGHVVPRRNDDNNDLLSPNSFYGGRNCSQTTLAPPTPRRDGIPSSARRHKAQSRLSPNDEDMSQQMVLRGSSHWNDNALHRMLREVFALAALCNQSDCRTFHIVRYHQAWLEDDGTLYIQTELCKSTLRDEMKSEVMSVSRQFKILREVLLALELVHEQSCIHLDIKPENIFVKDNVYKLGDFGTATLRNEKMIADTGGKSMDVEEGDSRYMPRDLLENNTEHQDLTKSDIFSLGITMYETCIDRPLPICGQEWQDLRDGKFSKPAGINPTLYFILKQMMHPDPSKRPSATDLLSRSELSANSDNIFLSSASNALSKGTRSLPLKRSASWTL
jgi:wee1-like protein kinase